MEGNLRFKIDCNRLQLIVFERNVPSTSPRGLIFGGAI